VSEHRLRLKDKDLGYLMVALGRYIADRILEGAGSRDLEEPLILYQALRRALRWRIRGRRETFYGWFDGNSLMAEGRRQEILREISEIGTKTGILGTVPIPGSREEEKEVI